MGILVRRIEKGDLGEVCAMWSALGQMFPCEEYQEGLGQKMTPERLFLLAPSLNPRSVLEVLVAEIDGQVVGFVDFTVPGSGHIPMKDVIYIGELFVKPEHRGRGVGTALVKEVVRIGREKSDEWGVRRIVTNAGDEAFHESLGFMPMRNPQRQKVPMWSHEYLL